MLESRRCLPLGCDCDECTADPLYGDSQRLLGLLDRMFERIALARGAQPVDEELAALHACRDKQLRHPARWTWRDGRTRRLLLMATADELKVVLCGYEAELERLRFELGLVEVRTLYTVDRHGCELGKRDRIRTARGPAHSLCVNFDLEKWLFAVYERWGLDPHDWPRPLRREYTDEDPEFRAAFAQ